MSVVMEDWCDEKFVVVDIDSEHIIVLSDIEFWVNNYEKLADWCKMNKCKLSGMTVTIPEPKIVSLFVLTWS